MSLVLKLEKKCLNINFGRVMRGFAQILILRHSHSTLASFLPRSVFKANTTTT